jgi:hypothetical protein
MARNMLLAKLAPSFRTILGNSEGPLMELFSQFTRGTEKMRLQPKGGQSSVRNDDHAASRTRPATKPVTIGLGEKSSQPDRSKVDSSDERSEP